MSTPGVLFRRAFELPVASPATAKAKTSWEVKEDVRRRSVASLDHKRPAFVSYSAQWVSLLFLLLVLCSCKRTPVVTVNPVVEGESTLFRIETKQVNGLLGLTVRADGDEQPLWEVDLAYFAGDSIIYGVAPTKFVTFNGNTKSGSQTFPPKGQKPEPLPPDRVIFVDVAVQYDSLGAAMSRTFRYEFRTDSDGVLHPVGN